MVARVLIMAGVLALGAPTIVILAYSQRAGSKARPEYLVYSLAALILGLILLTAGFALASGLPR